MSAQVLSKQRDILDSLKELLEAAKNPDVISQAYDLARKENALTESEMQKTADARIFLAAYEAKLADVDAETKELNDAIARHRKEVSEFIESSNIEKQESSARLVALDKKEKELIDLEAKNTTERAALDAYRADNDKQRAANINDQNKNAAEAAELRKKVDEVNREKTNISESKRRLKAGTDKLREQFSEIGM